MADHKRLYITPFNPDLLHIILPGDLLQRASDISFHTIQSSPQSNFGYVDLPPMDAQKLKKKLNGSILRGTKMHVEDARPVKPLREPGDDLSLEDADASGKKVKRRSKEKVNKSEGVVVGLELPDGRKVQRGWTSPAVSSKGNRVSRKREQEQTKKAIPKASKFTNKPECLFKTKVPPNKLDLIKPPDEAKSRKRKRGAISRDAVIHEFTNTKRHANFLRDDKNMSVGKVPLEHVASGQQAEEGGDLIDAKLEKDVTSPGVVERENRSTNRKSKKGSSSKVLPKRGLTPIKLDNRADRIEQSSVTDETSSSGTSSSSDSGHATETKIEVLRVSPTEIASGKVSDCRDTSEVPSNENEAKECDDVVHRVGSVSIKNQSSATFEESTKPEKAAVKDGRSIHPLESLFKQPKIAASTTLRKPALEVSTSFSFFDPDPDAKTNASLLMPQTPFTQQDFRERRQRSAAPTPDTAAPGRTFGDVLAGDSGLGNDEDEEGIKPSSIPQEVGEGAPESDFSKWFWENRGETNRAWKRRRREAAKEKRHRGSGRT